MESEKIDVADTIRSLRRAASSIEERDAADALELLSNLKRAWDEFETVMGDEDRPERRRLLTNLDAARAACAQRGL